MTRVWCLAALCFVAWGCAAEAGEQTDEQASAVMVREPEPLATGDEQRERLCSRNRSDLVLDAFCFNTAPRVESLADLRSVLEVDSNENLLKRGFALTGHSTSLSARSVSAINPRIVFVQFAKDEREMLSLAYTRGEQFAEVVVRDRIGGELQFYLITYEQECNERPGGCTPGDLLTEATERGWRNVNVYAEEDLANTPFDCRVCHQPEGPGTPKILRMQELRAPWTHWFWRLREGGASLIADYYAAKGEEAFAGVPGELIEMSQPGLLTALVALNSGEVQPNQFDSPTIEKEVAESAAMRGGNQPEDNSVPGESDEWQRIYEIAKRGDAISVPYHDVKVTDETKLAAMTQAYQDYRASRLERDALPDIRKVFPDDPELRARMGLATEPGLDGEGVLLQACGQCHNDRLDQSLSRARFNVDLARLDRVEKDRAIARIQLDADDPALMPPARFRTLSPEARERLVELLEQ